MRTERIGFLDLKFDRLTFRQVKGRLRAVTSKTPYGYIVTPNVDHVVRLNRDPTLGPLYEDADLCLCDSRILRLLARLSGIDLPLVAGSDLSDAIFNHVLNPGDTIAVIGANADLLERLSARFPDVNLVHHVPPMGLRHDAKARRKAAAFLASAGARFTFITVGSPQQEMIAREAGELSGASGIALCVGAGLEFLTGDQKRAPRPLRLMGLEWTHRLATNPRRLWRRYLVDGPRILPIYFRWSGRERWTWWPAGAALLAFAIVVVMSTTTTTRGGESGPVAQGYSANSSSAALPLNLPPPDLLRPLSPEEAAKENAERPFVKRPDTPAAKFVLRTDADDRDRALNCLAQAVYYEAAGEGPDGERAVAQVVLNRMHHPGYPASICGVVYQGSDRPSGCQFTFTCDGSLLRTPVPVLWTRAHKIAEDALAGQVFAAVGHATHYHADYVLPYWADSLDKTVQIGRHIFYRLRSTLGESRAFAQRYAGVEPEVHQPGSAVVLPPSEMTEQLAGALISEGLNGATKDVEKAGQPPATPLAADLASGTLMGDSPAPGAKPRRPKSSAECAGSSEGKRLSPLSPADMRAAGPSPSC